MVIRGRTRGNGRQLSQYLLFMNENEDIRILDVNGRSDPNEQHLYDALLTMSLTSELTKSDKGLYHAQINPAYGDDARMTSESWMQAADLLGKELGFEDQSRVIVLHTKKGRTHAHVVWQRYDLQKGIMISDSFSRLAQDRARKEMERVFEHKQTPHRNVNRPEMKEVVSSLWKKAKTGTEFLKEAGKAGYIIAKGVQRRPFMVVDETGRSFDLVRQLDGIKTKEVRERLKAEKLLPEKEAIVSARAHRNAKEFDAMQKRAIDRVEGIQQQRKVKEEAIKAKLVNSFAESTQTVTKKSEEALARELQQKVKSAFELSTGDITKPAPKEEKSVPTQFSEAQKKANAFAENRDESLAPQTEKERNRQEMLRQLKEQQEKSRGKGLERS